MEYDKGFFANYVGMVIGELNRRGIKYNFKYVEEIFEFCNSSTAPIMVDYRARLYREHNDRYLMQCLYNLEEKADRGIITKEEWDKITEHFIFKKEYNN